MFKKVINLKSILCFYAIGFLFGGTSCNSYSDVRTSSAENSYGSYCNNPQYVATLYKAYGVLPNDSTGSFVTSPSYDLQITTLLKDARRKYGSEVTISNLRWDVKNGKKKVGVVYDVIKCK